MAGMTPEDVYSLAGAADPRLSPDGRVAAFVVWRLDREANAYRSGIWLVPADGSAPAAAFTSGAARDTGPRWSPDGTRIAFCSDRGGERAQLHVIPRAGGEARRLTDLPEAVGDHAWSPDGTRLAFVARVPAPEYEERDPARRAPRRITRLQYRLDDEGWTADRPRRVFTVPSDGSAPPVQLTGGEGEDRSPCWSPDGRTLAFVSARHADWDLDMLSDLYLVDAGGGEPRRLTATDGGCDAPAWSPGGGHIAHLFTPGGDLDWPRHARLALADATTGERRVLTGALDRNCAPYPSIGPPRWVGDRVVFGVEDAGDTHLYEVPADGSAAPAPVVPGTLSVIGFDATEGGRVHVASTPTCPGELYAGGTRLSDVTAPFTAARALAPLERFTAPGGDGAEIEAWLIRPPDPPPGPAPTLLSIHGGPYTQHGSRFLDELQVLAGAGYAVVIANPRGSSGYGEGWARAVCAEPGGRGGFGTVDADDLLAVLDEALRRYDDVCDAGRVGVLGGSYGGLMTSWLIGHTDRFAAAVSERAVNHWPAFFGSSDVGPHFRGYMAGAYPFEDPGPWVRASPAVAAPDIHTPLLILHSEDDLRCSVEQAQHLFASLRLMGREVEMVRFPAEGHELSRSGSPMHRVMRLEIILEWFGRHL